MFELGIRLKRNLQCRSRREELDIQARVAAGARTQNRVRKVWFPNGMVRGSEMRVVVADDPGQESWVCE